MKFLLALLLMISPAVALDMSDQPPSENVETFVMPVNAAGVCVIASEADFMDQISDLNPHMLQAPKDVLATFLTKVNEARAKNGLFPFEAEKLIIGLFEDGGANYVGTVMIDNVGCVVIGSVAVFTVEEWAGFMVELGLSTDMFVEYKAE